MKFGSLFSGIGGLDLGLERAGMECAWQSEIDPYASQVLAKHWPTVPNLGNIKEINWNEVENVDLICGGYPCQPFSLAGNRAGTDDPRHLWPYFANAIRVLRPRFAILENVPGHLTLGFDTVLADLAQLRYDAEWSLVSACSMGASHMRKRLFVVAYDQSVIWDGNPTDGLRSVQMLGAERQPGGRGLATLGGEGRWPLREPVLCGGSDGIPNRVDRMKALGNSVVPQVAESIGRVIMSEKSNFTTEGSES